MGRPAGVTMKRWLVTYLALVSTLFAAASGKGGGGFGFRGGGFRGGASRSSSSISTRRGSGGRGGLGTARAPPSRACVGCYYTGGMYYPRTYVFMYMGVAYPCVGCASRKNVRCRRDRP